MDFFLRLREDGFPVSLHEYLGLLEGLKKDLANSNLDDFYYLSRSLFVKNEIWLDRYDEIFGNYFNNEEIKANLLLGNIPEEWLRKELEKHLSKEEFDKLSKMDGIDALMKRFRELLDSQKDRHQGGSQMIGTGGVSPFGNGGQNPEGFKIGGEGEGGGGKSSVKNWNMREFTNLRGDIEINTRQLKMALRKLRILTRDGRQDELDIDTTIRRTSDNAGMLDISMRPQRKNRVKVVLFMDAGGSMYEHVKICEQLFSAARHEFKNLEYFYFHNCIYDKLWRDNKRQFTEATPTMEVLSKYKRDYKAIILGDAAMAPYELHARGGGYEYSSKETGIKWLERIRSHFDHTVWINPNPDYGWHYYNTTKDIRKLFKNRMYPLTLDGLGKAMKALKDPAQSYDEVWHRA